MNITELADGPFLALFFFFPHKEFGLLNLLATLCLQELRKSSSSGWISEDTLDAVGTSKKSECDFVQNNKWRCGRMTPFSPSLSDCISFTVSWLKIIFLKFHKSCSHALHLTSSVVLYNVLVAYFHLLKMHFLSCSGYYYAEKSWKIFRNFCNLPCYILLLTRKNTPENLWLFLTS